MWKMQCLFQKQQTSLNQLLCVNNTSEAVRQAKHLGCISFDTCEPAFWKCNCAHSYKRTHVRTHTQTSFSLSLLDKLSLGLPPLAPSSTEFGICQKYNYSTFQWACSNNSTNTRFVNSIKLCARVGVALPSSPLQLSLIIQHDNCSLASLTVPLKGRVGTV